MAIVGHHVNPVAYPRVVLDETQKRLAVHLQHLDLRQGGDRGRPRRAGQHRPFAEIITRLQQGKIQGLAVDFAADPRLPADDEIQRIAAIVFAHDVPAFGETAEHGIVGQNLQPLGRQMTKQGNRPQGRLDDTLPVTQQHRVPQQGPAAQQPFQHLAGQFQQHRGPGDGHRRNTRQMEQGGNLAEDLAPPQSGQHHFLPAFALADLDRPDHQNVDPRIDLVALANSFAGAGAAHHAVIQQVTLFLRAQQITEGQLRTDRLPGNLAQWPGIGRRHDFLLSVHDAVLARRRLKTIMSGIVGSATGRFRTAFTNCAFASPLLGKARPGAQTAPAYRLRRQVLSYYFGNPIDPCAPVCPPVLCSCQRVTCPRPEPGGKSTTPAENSDICRLNVEQP